MSFRIHVQSSEGRATASFVHRPVEGEVVLLGEPPLDGLYRVTRVRQLAHTEEGRLWEFEIEVMRVEPLPGVVSNHLGSL